MFKVKYLINYTHMSIWDSACNSQGRETSWAQRCSCCMSTVLCCPDRVLASLRACCTNPLLYFGVGLVKQSDWWLLPAIPMAFLLLFRWKQSWSFASSLKACRNRLTASLSIFQPAKNCVAAAWYWKSSSAVPKTLPKTGEKTSVGIRQKSDKYEPQWREKA